MDVLPAGHEIGGYRIVRVAGRGAVGVVYEARHITLGKKVAIKTLNKLFAKEPEFLARFNREAESGSSVDHPNITTVLDHGEQDGLPYLVMTYVDGPDLERILQDRDGPLEPAEAVLICTAVAEALDAAAEKGLSHRDVKPANILLADWDKPGSAGAKVRPQVYLTDFGLTKHNAAATVTRTGQFVGTLLYMAPEQIEGKAVPASDQYSLACVLWECIVGLPPFLPAGGSNLSLLTAHLSDPIPLVSQATKGQFSRELDTVFATAMAKKAGDRYPSNTAFMAAAAEVMGLSGLTTREEEPEVRKATTPATPPPASRSWSRPEPSATPDADEPGAGDGPGAGAGAGRGQWSRPTDSGKGWSRSPKAWGAGAKKADASRGGSGRGGSGPGGAGQAGAADTAAAAAAARSAPPVPLQQPSTPQAPLPQASTPSPVAQQRPPVGGPTPYGYQQNTFSQPRSRSNTPLIIIGVLVVLAIVVGLLFAAGVL